MTDIVFISDLRVETVIGIYDWERKIRQTVSLDLEMAADIAKPDCFHWRQRFPAG